MSNATTKIEQAVKVLENWKKSYESTKKDIEEGNTMNRWEFTSTK